MSQWQELVDTMLLPRGLNLVAVLDATRLPVALRVELQACHHGSADYGRVLLLGHGGRAMWTAMRAAGVTSDDPIDDFTIRTVERLFAALDGSVDYVIVYPGRAAVPLQALASAAGWNHPSPLGLHIHPRWGPWHAYRAVVLCNADLPYSRVISGEPPCRRCRDKPCLAACPAGATGETGFDVVRCVTYRCQARSKCREACIARRSCPVGAGERYSDAQIRYHYSRSLTSILDRS